MPSPKTLLPTSQSTCESTILPLPSLFIYFIMGFGNGKQTKFKIWGRPILHRYANEDVSLGSWFIGLEVDHVDEHSMCCGTPPGT